LPELRALLATHSSVWRAYGDLGRALEEQLIRLAAGDDLLLQESLRREVEERRRELAGACPSPLECLLAERAAVGWLEAYYYDLLAAQNPGVTGAQERELRRRREAAHRRLLSAAKMLTLIRALAMK
jgi:hypothetical protein